MPIPQIARAGIKQPNVHGLSAYVARKDDPVVPANSDLPKNGLRNFFIMLGSLITLGLIATLLLLV